MSVSDVGGPLRESLLASPAPAGAFLPESVLEMQRFLAPFSDGDLHHLVVAAAVQLAARAPGLTTPDEVLRSVLPHLQRLGSAAEWLERVKPEVQRLVEEANAGSGREDGGG